MATDSPAPTVAKVIGRVLNYHLKRPTTSSLSAVFDDDLVDDDSIRWCVDFAIAQRDSIGADIGRTLLAMPILERRRLVTIVRQRPRMRWSEEIEG